jgi:hypothetical protein
VTLGRITLGIDIELEDRATGLLMKDRKDRGLKGKTAALRAEEYCWLTDWQMEERQLKEVYTTSGTPDPNILEGRVFRAYNPLFGKRPSRLQAADR